MSTGDIALLILILGISCYVVFRSFAKPKCRCDGCPVYTCEHKIRSENQSSTPPEKSKDTLPLPTGCRRKYK